LLLLLLLLLLMILLGLMLLLLLLVVMLALHTRALWLYLLCLPMLLNLVSMPHMRTVASDIMTLLQLCARTMALDIMTLLQLCARTVAPVLLVLLYLAIHSTAVGLVRAVLGTVGIGLLGRRAVGFHVHTLPR